MDGAGVDDWTGDQLFIQDTYGSPNLQVTTFWSKAGVLGIALEWPQNDCEVAFVDLSSGPDLLEPGVL